VAVQLTDQDEDYPLEKTGDRLFLPEGSAENSDPRSPDEKTARSQVGATHCSSIPLFLDRKEGLVESRIDLSWAEDDNPDSFHISSQWW